MSCFCCKNPYKICVLICNNSPLVVELPIISQIDANYTLHIDFLGGVYIVDQLQVAGQPIKFNFLPNELNEDYCYQGEIFDNNKNIVNFGIDNEYDCIKICTKLSI